MAFTEELMQVVRENRSSESNFHRLLQHLEKAIALAEKENNTALAKDLQEVEEKYAAAYQKAKESGGTSWPEFEKFVTQFERSLTGAAKDK
jgi:hypothetical protein